MAKIFVFIGIGIIVLFTGGCVNNQAYQKALTEREELQQKYDSVKKCLLQADKRIKELQDSITLLAFPADQRYNAILNYISEEKYDKAKIEIETLKKIFPMSTQASDCDNQLNLIEKRIAEKKAEEERIKSLGFKALVEQSVVKIGNMTCTFSGFTFGKEFRYDYCYDVGEYSYSVADKDETYLLASMTISTKEKDVTRPTINVYKVKGSVLKRLDFFVCNYATWSSYGAKIGNYNDETHDFSKVNSVKYNIGAEIKKEDMQCPIIVIAKKDGEHFYKDLTLDEVIKDYYVIKFLNKHRL